MIKEPTECVGCGLKIKTKTNRAQNKYCSRECSNRAHSAKGDASPHWLGGDVDSNPVFKWLQTYFGKACKCDTCGGSKKVQWVKLGDRGYEMKRENFQRLCRGCRTEHVVTMSEIGNKFLYK